MTELSKKLISNYLEWREKQIINDSMCCREQGLIIFLQGKLNEIRLMKEELKKRDCFKLNKFQEAIKNG